MKKEELAALLTGREYCQEITKEEEAQAKAAGLLVIFGGSDDLMEFRGAEHDERGAPTIALIDSKGLLPFREDIQHDDDALKDYFARAPMVRAVDALWCKEDGYSWTYRTDLPHATFEIVEGDEKYCRGIVIDLADLASPTSLDADHALALEINARCYGEPLPGGQRYSRTTFKDNGDPILLGADGKRSVFCDLCDDMEDAA